MVTVDYPRSLIAYTLAVALDGQKPFDAMRRLLPPDRLYPATRDGAAAVALGILGARPGAGMEAVVHALWGGE